MNLFVAKKSLGARSIGMKNGSSKTLMRKGIWCLEMIAMKPLRSQTVKTLNGHYFLLIKLRVLHRELLR